MAVPLAMSYKPEADKPESLLLPLRSMGRMLAAVAITLV